MRLVGKECWIPYAYHGREFRIGHDGTKRLWSPQHRIFKQGREAKWEPVFKDIVRNLRHRRKLALGQVQECLFNEEAAE
jgi:hypothetical protein